MANFNEHLEPPFFMVLRRTGGGAPNKRHATLEDAQAEAARLARQSDEEYYVLKTVGMVAHPKTPFEWKEL